MMKTITLRPADPERDFAQLAAWFRLEQDEPASEASLRADHEGQKERIVRLMVAQDPQGELLGFNWATRSRADKNVANAYLIVKPAQRGQGTGRRLYQDLERAANAVQIKQLRITVRDDCPACLAFAERRGFVERSHTIGMQLDLSTFDDHPYEAKIVALQAEGFQFTSMAALGDTLEARRKLYTLNDMTDLETPGGNGEHNWLSFDDFQQKVCQANWYRPAGQMVVIDTANGNWAGLSAITRFEGTDYAYNLHTGIDKRYRGRKLGQSVKVLALRYARQGLQVKDVQTRHNILNDPMIAIDRKFGYVQIPGMISMGKVFQ